MKQLLLLALMTSFSIAVLAQQERPSKAEMEARMEQVKAACKEDTATYCSDAEGREVMKCLHDNKENLSASCLELLPKGPPHKHGEHPHGPPPPPPASSVKSPESSGVQ